ncbi:MAG: hypothetical protein A2Z29_01625 [Chloroflexi bacterium RBG_16_56_11]|nr:MAG: hypothetical protein A2Z29_01625 [Chloroflexi bacterium RBG_16_56_11]
MRNLWKQVTLVTTIWIALGLFPSVEAQSRYPATRRFGSDGHVMVIIVLLGYFTKQEPFLEKIPRFHPGKDKNLKLNSPFKRLLACFERTAMRVKQAL